MNWIEKWLTTFYDGHDGLYHHAKFGGDQTTRIGCRCEYMVFVTMFFCLSRTHAARPVHCLLEGGIVRTGIALPFIGRFQRDFRLFFI